MIVYNIGEMVRRIAVGLEQHLVVDLLVIKRDRRTKRIVYDRRAALLHLETHHTGLSLLGGNVCGCQVTAVSVITQHVFLLTLLLTHSLQTFWGTPTAIGGTGREQLLGIALIQGETLRLPVRSVRTAHIRAFVPLQPDPAQRAQDRFFITSMRARLIRVFNTDEKLPTVGSGKDIVKEPNIGSPHMGYARRTRGNTYTYVYLGHDDVHTAAAARAVRIRAHQAAGSTGCMHIHPTPERAFDGSIFLARHNGPARSVRLWIGSALPPLTPLTPCELLVAVSARTHMSFRINWTVTELASWTPPSHCLSARLTQ